MSDIQDEKTMITCPACTAEFPETDDIVCPNCGAEQQSPEAAEAMETEETTDSGESTNTGMFPETTSVEPAPIILTDGLDLNIDPTTLSQEQLTITVNNIRKMVNDNKQVADATIAYGIKCIAIMRQARPSKDPSARAKPIARTMNLDDF